MRGFWTGWRRWVPLTAVLLAAVVLPSAALGAAAARVRGPAPSAQRLALVLPLAADTNGLKAFATAVTTPGSPEYGQYESIPRLASRFGASAPHRAKVLAFLRAAGARQVRIDATGLFADATVTVAQAQRLFGAPLVQVRAARSGPTYTTPSAPVRIPAGLRGLVTGVAGLDTRPVASAPTARTDSTRTSAYQPSSGTPSGCSAALQTGGFAPNQYLTAYGYDALHQSSLTGQGERVALIEIDGFRSSDISNFAACFGLRLPQINGFGVGVSRPLPPGGETTLDLEVLDAAAPGLKSIDVYETRAGTSAVLRALTAPLQNSGFKPQVISASLGLCEQDTYSAAGRSAIVAAEGALQMAAASGISFLAASGDDGSSDCVNGTSASAPPAPVRAVNYPASSPWVTGVGGTNLQLNPDNTIQSQLVWNDGPVVPGAAGGGGYSVLFDRPGYQKAAVPPKHGRAVPDVALLADIDPGYDVYCSASPECVNSDNTQPWQTVGGTSAATPLLAGGLAIIDQELREHQLQSLGLVNPLLYRIGGNAAQAAAVFHDVTEGSNDVGPFIPGFGRSLGCCSAARGFDAASGWGGVNLSELAALALATQPRIVDVSLSLPPRQHPVRSRHLLAIVGCSGRCLAGAFARVTIGRRRPFTAYSALHHYSQAGRHTITVGFSKAQLSRLRAALRHHTRIEAAVIGAIVDAGGNIERRTSASELRITG